MDLPDSGDVLSQATRARIFAQMAARKGAASTVELAEQLDLHPNGVRRHLEQLHEAGLVERQRRRGSRGRPGDLWLVATDAHPGGKRPSGYADLARATPAGPTRLRAIEKTGREIGRELAPRTVDDPAESFRRVVAALGITVGLLAELDPEANLTRFEAHDPDSAGCLVGVGRARTA